MEWDVRCVVNSACQVGEGPVWDVEEQRLLWVDIQSKAVHAYYPGSGDTRKWQLMEMIGFILPCHDGGWVGGFASGLAYVQLNDDLSVEIGAIDRPESDEPDNRFNDGTCDSAGRLWCGTMNMPGTNPSGKLYCYDHSRTARTMDDNYVVTNGPAISCDGRILYHCETSDNAPEPQGIYVFDLDGSGTLSNKRLLVDYRPRRGMPDGLTIDAQDRLWVGEWGGKRLSCFDSRGRLLQEISLPTTNITKAAFGSRDLDVLYVTSAAAFLPEDRLSSEPVAGGVFAIEGLGRGMPPCRFDRV